MGYTESQKEAVDKILRYSSSQYYEMLGVSQNATTADVERAYKKLAMEVHPDKNQAPGSTEAFKVVSAAKQILSNKEKKAEYDRALAFGNLDDLEKLVSEFLHSKEGQMTIMAGIAAVGGYCLYKLLSSFGHKRSRNDEHDDDDD